jgi:ATP-dependent DNA helicase DinG
MLGTYLRRIGDDRLQRHAVYAVVDLETTGNSVKKQDRIIQFGCVLVKNGQIIDRFATLVNPNRAIPPAIQHLTHIAQQDVAQAPYFEDVAPVLHQLLENKVFVAHNIEFDLPFLNAEFQRVGFSPLAVEGVDTLQLANILLPTSVSFRLPHLAHYLSLTHEHPHRADSDAEVTGRLLMTLTKRLQQLPTLTQQQLVAGSTGLLRQTGAYMRMVCEAVTPRPLPDYLMQVDQLVLRRPQFKTQALPYALPAYPASDQDKQQLFKPTLKWRKTQGKMMDLIYQNFADQPVPILLEAATGLGKSLGYLLPLVYRQNQTQQQIVVSTATTTLQNQFSRETVPLLNEVLGTALTVEVLKSNRHYLNLWQFQQSFATITNEQDQLLKLRLLVWLTMTKTGDLDELHFTNYQSLYFTSLAYQAWQQPVASPFQEVDFLARQQQARQTANIVVTNHAYLAAHAADWPTQPSQPYLVIDEANQFLETALRTSQQKLGLLKLQRQLKHLREQIGQAPGRHNLAGLFAATPLVAYQLTMLNDQLAQLQSQLIQLQQALWQQYGQQPATVDHDFWTIPLNSGDFDTWWATQQPLCQRITQLFAEIGLSAQQLQPQLKQQAQRWTAAEWQLQVRFFNQLQQLLQDEQQFQGFQQQLQALAPEARVLWLTLKSDQALATLELQQAMFDAAPVMQQILTHFAPPLLTGATLRTGRDFHYFKQQLGLTQQTLIEKKLASPFRYKRQAQLLTVTDGPSIKESQPYSRYVAQAVEQLCQNNQRQTLVLFNALGMIRDVYDVLSQSTLLQDREILAQGINGSQQRLAKRFALGQGAILLGAASFWSGVDFPDQQLEQLVIVRLPFASPYEATTQAYYQRLKAQGQDPFKTVALPQATLRLRQGVGRLIRTPQDYGLIVLLDQRGLTTRYGQQMLHALPTSLPKDTATLTTLTAQADAFFAEKLKKRKSAKNSSKNLL